MVALERPPLCVCRLGGPRGDGAFRGRGGIGTGPRLGGRKGGCHCQTGGSAAWLERSHRVQLSHQEFAFSDWIGRADRLATVLTSGGPAATHSRGGGACLPRLRNCLRKQSPASG